MSRSRKKTPVFGNAIAQSEKDFKTAEHRRERRAVKAVLPLDAEILPDPVEFGNPYNGPKDGKHWWQGRREKDMRK